jgi:hypothetical protein
MIPGALGHVISLCAVDGRHAIDRLSELKFTHAEFTGQVVCGNRVRRCEWDELDDVRWPGSCGKGSQVDPRAAFDHFSSSNAGNDDEFGEDQFERVDPPNIGG